MVDLITAYINLFEGIPKQRLLQMREIVSQSAPEAIEKISYKMPTYYLNGNLVHFAAFKNHIGFYPSSDGIEKFEDQLQDFKHSKGAIQFSYNEQLPVDLIKEIVLYRVSQNKNKK
ncbi:MAG: DUF1801 domain-containing protein [Firmicutes bacterium]|nr:DUF1801 domain-containing protein [Bacillota bacterium]